MNRIFLSLAFILAIGAAFFTYAASSTPLVTSYFQANPSNVAGTCEQLYQCGTNTTQTCTVVKPNFSTYKSETGEPVCHTLVSLRRNLN